jgi:hypothetical protein
MDVGKESDPIVIGRQSPEIFDKGWAPKGYISSTGDSKIDHKRADHDS